MPLFQAYRAHLVITGDEAIHTGEDLRQLAPALLQAHGAVFRGVELLTDVWPQRRPAVLGNEIRLGIGIAPTACHPDIARTQGPTQFPEGTELIVVPINGACGSRHIRPPLHGDEVGW